jgi:signal transduction histidine kinase
VRSILQFSYWPQAGPIFTLFIIFGYLGLGGYGIFQLFKAYKQTSGYKHAQIKYVLLGSAVGLGGGFSNIPLWYGIPLPPYGNFLVFLYPFILAYAITHYRLMDIRIAIGRTAIYIFSFLSVIGISFSLVSLNNRLLQPISFNILGPSIIVIAVLLFQFFFRFFEKLASRYFYYSFYSYQKVIGDLGKKLNKILDLKRLSSLIVDTLIKTMQLDRTVVLMREESGHYAILRNIGFKEENGISLVKDNFLTKYLERTRKSLVYEELFLVQKETVFKKEKENLERLQKNMKKIEANLCLPLFREDKIIGVIVLGKKISGDPYSQEDIELLTTLSTQASVALDNARLYEKVQDLSQNLQEKVDQQTRELKEAYEKINKSYQIEKKAHQELKHLDEAKNQFVMATQHHLRTPLTIMKGYVSMILEGDYGKANKETRKKLVFFQQSTEKLIRLVNEFLDISQFKVGKGVLNLQKVKVEDLVREIVKELKPEAENKGIYLKLKKPASSPFVQVDPAKFKEAIYNIIDNGVKYTEKGGVMVDIKRQKAGTILIVVKDTGMGMGKEELDGLFKETFERSKGAKKLYALGRGIGLYIASNIIKAHRSKIWAESPGKDKGSTFYIELPVK